MSFTTFSKRLAATGAASALAAGVLVGATSTAANAATVTSTYTCSIPTVYSGDFPMTVTGELPVPQYWASAPVIAGLLPVTASAEIPEDAQGLLELAQVDGAKSDDFAFSLGTSSVPAALAGDFSEDYSTWSAEGANGDFKTPKPGTYDVVLPESFTMTTVKDGADSASLTCVIKEGTEPAALTSIDLLQQPTTTMAPAKVKVKKGKAAKIPVTVTGEAGNPVGKVLAKKGKKTLDSAKLKAGKATLNLGKLKLGKHKIKVLYKGNASFTASSDKTVVRVVR